MNKITLFGQANKNLYKILEDDLQESWNFQNFENIKKTKMINFLESSGSYQLENDEIFFIKLTSKEIDEINSFKNTTITNNIDKESILKIKFIYLIYEDKIYFQRILPSNYIDKPFFSFFTEKDLAKLEKNKKIIILNDKTDVVFDGEKVYFKDFNNLEKIFKNFSKYYREAGEKDFENLQNSININLAKEFDLKKINKTSLRKIAQICDNLDIFQTHFSEYEIYAKIYEPKNKNFNDSKFNIDSDEDIKFLHDIIFEKFYTAQVAQNQKRLVNSYKLI